MTGRTTLALAILAWTALTWGGRIRLLTAGEQDLANWLRIGGSIFVAAAAAAVLWLLPQGQLERWVLTLFAGWSAAIWARSLLAVWSNDNSMGFRVVHTILAVGFFALAYLALATGWSLRR